jgi:hypothetical protein
VVVCFVDIGGIVDYHSLEVVVCFVDIGGIVDHLCSVVGNKTNNHLSTVMVNNTTNINKINNHL